MRRVFIFLGLMAFYPAQPLWAQEPLASQLRGCAAIMGSVERLACYDRLARPVPPPIPIPPSPPVSNQVADFGADSMPDTQPAPIPRSLLASVTSQVTAFSFDARGHFTVTLSNGQVWRQIEGDTVNVPLRKGYTRTATVSRAILGSYSIRFDDPRGLFKVVRVQ